MRLHFPLLALLALAGCAHSPNRTTSAPPPVAALPVATSVNAVQLNPVDLAVSPSANPALVTLDSWLDDYFATVHAFEEMEYRTALAKHPEWAPQIEAKRLVSAEDENVARAAFLYILRNGAEGVFWSDGDWMWNVIPCNCGKIHHIKSPGWSDRFQRLTEARIALEKISDVAFQNDYLRAGFDLKTSLKPRWESEMERLKPGFFRIMREPAQPDSGR